MAALAHMSVVEELPDTALPQDGDRPANWGNMLAVIIGDFLLSKAYELSAEVSSEVSRTIASAIASVCEGRVLEQRTEFRSDLALADWLKISTLKIATLFELPCRLGAALCGSEHTEALAEYGRNFGLAFMLTDQVLELRGNSSEMGKLLVHDFSKGIYSKPVCKALRGPGEERLRSALARGDRREIVNLVEASGALEESLAEAEEYARRAQSALTVPDSPARRTLWRLADYAVHRVVGQSPDLRGLL